MTQTITQAMILAAGKGTRLRPFTYHTPKPLFEIGGQPVIVWHIQALKQAGIKDITINTSWLSDKLISALGDGSQYEVNIHWSVEDGEPLETAGGIAKALHDQKLANEPFILINGDICTDYPLAQLAKHTLEPHQLAHLILVNNPAHNLDGDFYLHQGHAYYHLPAPDEHLPKYTFSGISVVSPNLLKGISPEQVQPLAPLLRQAMQQQQITASLFDDGTWINADTHERMQLAHEWRLNQLSSK